MRLSLGQLLQQQQQMGPIANLQASCMTMADIGMHDDSECLNTVLCRYCLDRRACTISLLGLSIGGRDQWMTEHSTQVLG